MTQDMRSEGLLTMMDVEQWPEIKGVFHTNPSWNHYGKHFGVTHWRNTLGIAIRSKQTFK